MNRDEFDLRAHLLDGQVIPAHPLALNNNRKLDERRQRALTRYYLASGCGGLAVGVHTTQFEIREAKHNLYQPVLELAATTSREELAGSARPIALIAGVCGKTAQAASEAQTAASLGYDAALLSLGAWKEDNETDILQHCGAIADILPLVGFYLQPSVGGRPLSFEFWRQFAEIEKVVAIKIAPFNRYATLNVIRGVAASGRSDIALYTGNDDNIIIDLLTPFQFQTDRGCGVYRIVGGLLGQWAVWTRRAVEMLDSIKQIRLGDSIELKWLRLAAALTDANGAFFDVAHGFAGCIPGIHEVLRRQGLLENLYCLDPRLGLSSGQSSEIDRVMAAYPTLNDNEWVLEHRDQWLA